MKYKVAALILANNDLQGIYESLYDFGENPPKKFRESFSKFIENVSDMPFMFPEYERNPKYRKAALVYEYLVFYCVDEKNNTVKLYRILHGKRNIDSLL